jgi:hypothetical protein
MLPVDTLPCQDGLPINNSANDYSGVLSGQLFSEN